MSRINTSYYAILGILGFGPMSGYDMKMWVDEGVGFFVDIDYKQIYPTLKRLLDEGLATCKREKPGKRPERKVYSLTDTGLSELKTWLGKPLTDGKNSANELMLKLFLGHHISKEKNLEHVQGCKEDHLRAIRKIEELKECLDSEEIKDASWHYRRITVMNGEMMHKATVDWCDKIAEYMKCSIKD